MCTNESTPSSQQRLSLLARRSTYPFSLLVAFPERPETNEEVLTPATRRLRVQDSFQQGLAAVAEAVVLLPLMRLTAHSQSFGDSARQSVGVDGDDDT